jgi:hypothetical protein
MERRRLFLAFAGTIREGEYHNGDTVWGATIEETLLEVTKVLGEFGVEDPRRWHPAQHRLDAAFSSYYTKCKDTDPAPLPQLALPNTTVRWIATNQGAGSKRMAAVANLVVLGYFFLLRVGEYTPSTNKKRRKRTVPL